MAIEKKLICCKTQANFDKLLEEGDILDYSIVFIKDTQRIWTHGTYFSSLAELMEDISSKQDKLTAGTNVEITEDNVINVDIGLDDYETKEEAQASHEELQENIDAVTKDVEENYQPKGDYVTKDEIPTKTSELENDSGYITEDALVPYETTEDATTSHNELQANIDQKQDKLTAGTGIEISSDNVISSDIDLSGYETVEDAAKTHEELEESISTKQDKLTAGTGIAIEDNVVSSTIDTSIYETIEDANTSHQELEDAIGTKQDKLTAGTGIEITEDNILNVTIDNNPFVFVDELPTSDIKEGKLYCVPNEESTEENNIFDEYYYHNDAWELMGQYIPKVDLTQYEKIEDAEASHTELQEAIDTEVIDRENLIESSEDDDYVIKHIDSEGNILSGIKSNGEIYIPVGIPDDTYTLIEGLYEKVRDCVDYVSILDTSSTLICSDTDDEFVLKAETGNATTLVGIKENGEISVPIGVTDGAYDLIQALYVKLDTAVPALKEYVHDYTNSAFASNSEFHALVDTIEDEEYVVKVQDREGELLGAFTTTGEVKIPTGVTDDTYDLINAMYIKLAAISEYLKELQVKIDKLDV